MKLEEKNLGKFFEEFQDIQSPYYGGVAAYLILAINLSLFIKLMKKKVEKNPNNVHTYQTLLTLAQTIYDDSMDNANNDGKIFSQVASGKLSNREINDIILKQISFVLNLNTLKDYVACLIAESKGSVVADYIMILDAIKSAKENIIGIIKYEIKKVNDEELRNIALLKLSSL